MTLKGWCVIKPQTINQSDWLKIRSGCGNFIYSAWQGLNGLDTLSRFSSIICEGDSSCDFLFAILQTIICDFLFAILQTIICHFLFAILQIIICHFLFAILQTISLL